MTRTIDFYFDFPSPYSYLAHTQLSRIAAEHSAAVAYHPFRILELMKIVGNRPTTIECRNKSKYAGADLQRWTRRYKVDFARNPHLKTPRNVLTAPRSWRPRQPAGVASAPRRSSSGEPA